MAGICRVTGRPAGLRAAAQSRPLHQRLAGPGGGRAGRAAVSCCTAAAAAAGSKETEDDKRVHGEQHLADHVGDRTLAPRAQLSTPRFNNTTVFWIRTRYIILTDPDP